MNHIDRTCTQGDEVLNGPVKYKNGSKVLLVRHVENRLSGWGVKMNYCLTHWFGEGLTERAKVEGKEGWVVPWAKGLKPKLKALALGLFKAMFREDNRS